MLVIRCAELTSDEQLALAGLISEKMGGKALALARGDDIVLDKVGKGQLGVGEVESIVRDFLARRKDADLYSYEVAGEAIVVHSPDPMIAKGKRRKLTLPGNLFKCPFCGFVTPYEEMYVVHYRAHGFTL